MVCSYKKDETKRVHNITTKYHYINFLYYFLNFELQEKDNSVLQQAITDYENKVKISLLFR